jgi:ATP-dependent DNA helicase RecQ
MELTASLHELFGFPAFRPGQLEACQAALSDRDVLVVMPTGSGKSLCYQLPALLRDDLTIVVTPLVALMQDQVEALRARGLGDRVALVNAQQDPGANTSALAAAAAGELSLLYVAPERFSSPGFLEGLKEARVGLFVVDEAHCVSQWGHDFRPDYFRLADAARAVGARAVVASTATATPRVALDVARRLGLQEPLRIATGFDRPNLAFAVGRPAAHEKRALIAESLRSDDALPAIVYTGTRAGAEELASDITDSLGVQALPYHAGLERSLRADTQRRFLADEVQVIVATNAFGMGVDKPNVRTVLHATVPSSLEAYYQEAGRAGRDGLPARALLLAENRDKALHVHFIKRDEVEEGLPAWLAERIAAGADGDGRYSVDAGQLVRDLGGGGDRLRALLGHLARAGVLAPSPSAPDRVAGTMLGPFDRRAAAHCRASIEEGARARWRQYREIWAYVERDGCRRRAILRHFGDPAEPAGGAACCDHCEPSLLPVAPPPDPASYADLDDAIVAVADSARPAVGRTTCAEILHGARTKKIERNSYNGLPAYGSSANMRRADILARVDRLIEEGRIQTTRGPYPVLRVAA